MYPRDTKDASRPGRLRLLYEANPVGMIMEQAGGRASTGELPMLEVQPTSLHQRIGFVFGSKNEVERIERYHREPVKERSSGLDLFKRVTGLASLRRPTAPAKPAAAQPSMAAPAPAKSELLVKEPTRAPQQMPGVNPSERPQQARQDDDLLDIPSFLRRQAN